MGAKKNVLFISYDGITDPLGRSQVLPYLVGLSKEGYNITILSSEKPDNFKLHEGKIREIIEVTGINWEYSFYSNSIPLISTFLLIKELKKIARKIVIEKAIDIIHCRSIIPAMIGDAIKKENNAKFIFDIRGFWADEKVDGNLWNLSNPILNLLYKFFKRKEKDLFKKADCIVTLTENAREYISSHFITKNNFLVVPCCVDLDHFDYSKVDVDLKKSLTLELGIGSNDFILTYVGSLGTRYLVEKMMSFFKKLKEAKPNSKFLFISKHDSEYILNEAKLAGVDRDSILITSCEYADIPTYISLGNASIFFIVTSFSGKAVSPTKQAEVMSLGLPIVANSGLGDTDKILDETNTGIIVQDYSTKTFELAVKEVLNYKKPKEEVRKVAEEYFSLESGIKKYSSVYKNL